MNYLKKNDDENKTIIEIKSDWENQQYKNYKQKFKRIAIPIACCVVAGGIYVGNAIHQKERRERAIEYRNDYLNEQKENAQNSVSKAEAFIETMSVKLASEEQQYHKVLDGTVTLYNEATYTEDVKTVDLGILEWKWKDENITMYGYADAYFEYGTNINSLKFEATGEDTVTAYVAPSFFNEEASHRIKDTYSPHPEKSNKTSRDAKRKAQLEMQYEGFTDTHDNIAQRGWSYWEDEFDKNIKSSVYKLHSEDGTLSSLDKITEDSIKDLIDKLSTDKDVKVTVKVDKTLK